MNRPTFGLLATVLCLASAAAARAEFDGLFERVPRDVNAVMVIDVNRMLQTPLAERKFWRQ